MLKEYIINLMDSNQEEIGRYVEKLKKLQQEYQTGQEWIENLQKENDLEQNIFSPRIAAAGGLEKLAQAQEKQQAAEKQMEEVKKHLGELKKKEEEYNGLLREADAQAMAQTEEVAKSETENELPTDQAQIKNGEETADKAKVKDREQTVDEAELEDKKQIVNEIQTEDKHQEDLRETPSELVLDNKKETKSPEKDVSEEKVDVTKGTLGKNEETNEGLENSNAQSSGTEAEDAAVKDEVNALDEKETAAEVEMSAESVKIESEEIKEPEVIDANKEERLAEETYKSGIWIEEASNPDEDTAKICDTKIEIQEAEKISEEADEEKNVAEETKKEETKKEENQDDRIDTRDNENKSGEEKSEENAEKSAPTLPEEDAVSENTMAEQIQRGKDTAEATVTEEQPESAETNAPVDLAAKIREALERKNRLLQADQENESLHKQISQFHTMLANLYRQTELCMALMNADRKKCKSEMDKMKKMIKKYEDMLK